MAKAKVTHSTDGVTITLLGNKNHPEPSTCVIKFPGGHVEVSRCSDGDYWAHICPVAGTNIVDGRISRADRSDAVQELEDHAAINQIAIRISNAVPHFDPNS